ncbi:MAG: cell division protein FtsQ/DivIB, partial [Mariprofundaceae bacterium]
SARRAIALWAAPEGGLRLLDESGRPWRAPRKGEAPDLPLTHAPRARLDAIPRLLAALAETPDRLTRLSEIRADARGWTLIFDRGEAWRLPEKHAAARIAAIRKLLAKPRWRRLRWRIDARAPDRWFLRPAAHEGVI